MPAVAAYLREGRLSLTKLCLLKDVLAPDNCLTLLEQAASLCEKEVEELAVILDPRRPAAAPSPRDSIRPVVPPAPPPLPRQEDLFLAPPPPELPAPPVLHVIKMTVGRDFMTLLDEVRAELSHLHAAASLEVLLAESMKRALAAWRARSRGDVAAPRAPRAVPAADSRTIPAHVRRAVWKRDGGRCTFVSADGHRCTARHRLQLHHVTPFARGGAATVDNIRLACAAHNHLLARADFGDAHMDRFTAKPPAVRE